MTTAASRPALVPMRPAWAQAVTLFGCFVGAVGLGSAVGWLLQPEGDATTAVVVFALLLVFIGGLACWGMIGASIMAKAFFSGDLMAALLRFFLRGRRREDLPNIQLDREKLQAAGQRVFGWSRLFVWFAVGTASLAAPLAGWFASRGFLLAGMLTGVVIIGYGIALRALASAGYLFPPEVE